VALEEILIYTNMYAYLTLLGLLATLAVFQTNPSVLYLALVWIIPLTVASACATIINNENENKDS
jgi:hypothetical protein